MYQYANWLRYNDMPHGTLAYWYIIILAYYLIAYHFLVFGYCHFSGKVRINKI